jgi:exonuclease SbcC
MIPIHLSIQGLYSYQDRQEVDFTRLTEAGLFGIFGAVGSGKTTILEAMSLCLYGRTERFNLSGDDRYYNMLNLKVNEGLMSFTFLAGSDSKKFRADIKLRRNRNKYEDVKLLQHSYYLLENGMDPIPVDQSLVLAAVGISYDNFKRTLVIPQGQFREFLELKPKERTEMLKELFGLHRFDRSARVIDIAAANKNRLTEIEGGLIQLAAATEEELQALQEQLSALSKELSEWQSKQVERSALLQSMDSLKHITDALMKAMAQRDGLTKAVAEDDSLLVRIDRYEKLRDRYVMLLSELDALVKELNAKQAVRDRMVSERGQKEQALDKASREFSDADAKQIEAETLQPRVEELGKMAEIRRLAQEIADLEQKISGDQVRIENGQKKVIEEEEAVQLKRLQIDAWQPQILEEQRVFRLRMFYRDQDRFFGDVLREEQHLNIRLIQLGKTQVELKSLLAKNPERMIGHFPAELSEQGVHEMLEASLFDIHVEKEQVREQLTGLAIRKGLRQYAEGLVEGEPCILCGSTDHPNPLHVEHPDDDERRLQQQLLDLDNAERKVRIFVDQLKSAIRAQDLSNQELAQAEQQVELSRKALDTHQIDFKDDQFKPTDKMAFEQADKTSEDAKASVKQAQAAIVAHEDKIKNWNKGIDTIKITVNETRLMMTGSTTRYDLSVESVLHLDMQQYLKMDVHVIEQERADILASIERARKQRGMAEQIKTQLDRELLELTARIDQFSETLKGLNDSLSAKRAALEERLLEDGLTDSEVRDVLQWNPDLAAIRRGIDERRRQMAIIDGQIESLATQLAGRTYDQQQHLDAQAAFAEAEAQVGTLNQKRGATDGSIQKMIIDLDTRRKLEAELEALRIRGKDIATLQEMFRANGFVHFVSQRYLENVVAVANKRFRKMVRDKFSIELSPDGDFLVRDYLNDGKTRLLKSLSGGQTFQAALCLALALSENIQHTAGADQHFFFIDEGFGSLDSNSLEMVFATLQSLQHENKAVGVISHVAELQEGMDIYLHVENDPETGTRVRESWRDLS